MKNKDRLALLSTIRVCKGECLVPERLSNISNIVVEDKLGKEHRNLKVVGISEKDMLEIGVIDFVELSYDTEGNIINIQY